MAAFRKAILSAIIATIVFGAYADIRGNDGSQSDTVKSRYYAPKLDSLATALKSGKPTLGYFYYSVACSCTAARCAIASAAIDSISGLRTNSHPQLGFFDIDAFIEQEAESLYNFFIVPTLIYFDKNGVEINRLEWGMNRETITELIEHPDLKQPPID